MSPNHRRQPMPTAPRAAPEPGEVLAASLSNIGASPRRTLLEDRSRGENIRTAAGLKLALGVVADGIGGANAGERAAEITVSSVFEHCGKSTEGDVPKLLESALEEANKRVFVDARSSRRKLNMGSTAAVAAIVGGRLYVANVGDSRIYLIREGHVVRLTIDHTWQEEVVRTGRLSPTEAARHPRREEIVRSVGFDRTLNVDLGLWLRGGKESGADAVRAQGLPMRPGDQVVICSDGLTKTRHDNPEAHYVEEAEIPALIAGRPPQQAAETLVRRALGAKVDDNVSVVVLEMPGGKRAAAPFRLHPAVPAGLALLLVVAAGIVFLPRVIGSMLPSAPTPTIPPLPSGVAFVSEIAGGAEVEVPGAAARPLRPEEIVAAGPGVVLRTAGAGSYLRLGLADQSIVYLGPDTEIELAAIADGAQTLETTLLIHRGTVVVAAQGVMGQVVAVTAADGSSGRILGSVMGVTFDPFLPRMDIDCFTGACEIIDLESGRLPITINAGQHVFLAPDGSPSQPDASRNDLYSFANYCGGLVPAPSGGGNAVPATRTLGALYVPPTLPPTRRPTATQPEPPPPPGPTNTPLPPTDIPPDTDVPTNTQRPSHTPRSRTPTKTDVPTDTDIPPTNTAEPTQA